MNGFELLGERLYQFSGNFECHITVKLGGRALTDFVGRCQELGGSAVVIQLEGGGYPDQPMFAKYIDGSPNESLVEIKKLYCDISRDFAITRLKVEASITNKGIPKCDAEASGLPNVCYFEHHVRMNIPLNCDLQALKSGLRSFDAHVSNNALSKSAVSQVRFATQRFRNVGNEKASVKLEALVNFLSENGVGFDKVIREYNIFDSNAGLDAGWENGR